jgi:hypothetical protein
MKMTSEHYAKLKELYAEQWTLIEHERREDWLRHHTKPKDLQKRLRWDFFWKIHSADRGPLMQELYSYLDDTHIDTALKRIVKEVKLACI